MKDICRTADKVAGMLFAFLLPVVMLSLTLGGMFWLLGTTTESVGVRVTMDVLGLASVIGGLVLGVKFAMDEKNGRWL